MNPEETERCFPSGTEEPELVLHPSDCVEMTRMDRELMLDMSKVLVALGTRTNESKWACDLALTQFKYRQQFFPETIDP